MTKTFTLKSTTNYRQFSSLPGNRPVNPTHVKKLAASLAKENLMPCLPCIINKDGYIIDGQHRIAAAEKIGETVWYVVIPHANMTQIRFLNANLKPWGPREFAISFAQEGNPNYITLIAFHEKYKLPIASLAELLMGKAISRGGQAATALRDGSFKVKNVKDAEEFIAKLKDVVPFIEGVPVRNRDFIGALREFYNKGADHKKLVSQLQRQGSVGKQPDHMRWLLALQDTYNYHAQEKKIDVMASMKTLAHA